ncbi:hypothetical protein AWV80_41590 [Cupriavidus sp. UYMU48A]|nr:hypothetical protein AWV80_41590 [Cupriavidus sp. UYMU48A]
MNDRFSKGMVGFRTIHVTLFLDDVSREERSSWDADVRRLIGAPSPGVAVEVSFADSTNCGKWLEHGLSEENTSAQLVIAAQIWPDKGERVFSEAAAAFLLRPRIVDRRGRGNETGISVGRLYRLMRASIEDIDHDVPQLLSLQVRPGSPSAVLTTSLDEDTKAALLATLGDAGANVRGWLASIR